jgi:hypothetical protein
MIKWTKHGVQTIKEYMWLKSQKKRNGHRLNTLGETIKYWLKHRTDKTVEIIHLFYNN